VLSVTHMREHSHVYVQHPLMDHPHLREHATCTRECTLLYSRRVEVRVEASAVRDAHAQTQSCSRRHARAPTA
jgi:hypothetical protein